MGQGVMSVGGEALRLLLHEFEGRRAPKAEDARQVSRAVAEGGYLRVSRCGEPKLQTRYRLASITFNQAMMERLSPLCRQDYSTGTECRQLGAASSTSPSETSGRNQITPKSVLETWSASRATRSG